MKILKCNLTHLDIIYNLEITLFPPHIRETKYELMNDIKNGYYYGLFNDNNILIGYFCFYENNGLYLNNIVITLDNKGKGYSKIIIQYLKQHIVLYSIDRIWLHVFVQNDIAIGLYNKCGFRIKGNAKDFYALNEDALIMEFK